jgi:hypothetical protein
MTITFFDQQDKQNTLNGLVISDPEKIVVLLDSLKHRPPFLCELVGDNGCSLLVGVGTQYGCSQYSFSDGRVPYLMAVSTEQPSGNDYLEFLSADTPTPIAKRYCLPLETTQKIARYFVMSGGRYPEVEWEEI